MPMDNDEVKQYLKNMSENIEYLLGVTVLESWFSVLIAEYEATYGAIRRFPFSVEADVAPGTTFETTVDFTGTDNCCVSPKFRAASDLGSYVKLTLTLNESPVDVPHQWADKQATIDSPLPTHAENTLHNAEDFVRFPKRKVKVKFVNTHPTDTARCFFYTNYLQMDFRQAKVAMQNLFNPILNKVGTMMLVKRFPER